MIIIYNTTTSSSNVTTAILPIWHVSRNKGILAGVLLFVILLILIALIRRIVQIRNLKLALKKRFTKANGIRFDDNDEDIVTSKYGDLMFQIDYSFEKNSLIINLIQIFELYSPTNVEVDSYVRISIGLESNNFKSYKTKVISKNNNPVYTKKCVFKTNIKELQKIEIIFEIFDSDEGIGDVMLGIVKFSCSSLTKSETQELPIEKRVPIDPPIEIDNGKGEICIVLRHRPWKHLLNITILDAKRLKFKNKKRQPPVYVSVTMFHLDEKLETKNTTVRMHTRDPYFSETLTFHMKPVKAPYTTLVIRVIQKSYPGIDQCIGKLKIASYCDLASARKQWSTMNANPNIAIASWHSLN